LTGALLHFYELGYSFIDIMNLILYRPILQLVEEIIDSETEIARLFVNQFAGMDIKTLTGIFAELSNNIIVFATDPAIKNCLSCEKNITPFDLEKGFDIFLQIPEDKLDQWKPLVSLIINQFMKHFERRPDGISAPILFYLAEFPRLGKVEAVSGLATLRSKKIAFCLEIQALSQLDAIYGHAHRQTIVNNCAFRAVLNATDAETQDYFSRLVGTYDRYKVSYSRNFEGEDTDSVKGSGENQTTENVRIIKPEEFATLRDIVLLTPYGFCRAKKVPYYMEKAAEKQRLSES
jgi:type IV secretion system protein VirD4